MQIVFKKFKFYTVCLNNDNKNLFFVLFFVFFFFVCFCFFFLLLLFLLTSKDALNIMCQKKKKEFIANFKLRYAHTQRSCNGTLVNRYDVRWRHNLLVLKVIQGLSKVKPKNSLESHPKSFQG